MSTGNLIGKRVSIEFWPACRNCRYYEDCARSPRHPAYPHKWHWYHETIPLPDRTLLVTDSWVGTIAKGMGHTGCYSYTVSEEATLPLTEAMKQAIKARQRMEGLYQQASGARREREQERLWREYDKAEAEYERLLQTIKSEVEQSREDDETAQGSDTATHGNG